LEVTDSTIDDFDTVLDFLSMNSRKTHEENPLSNIFRDIQLLEELVELGG